jgi:hypothetical protein
MTNVKRQQDRDELDAKVLTALEDGPSTRGEVARMLDLQPKGSKIRDSFERLARDDWIKRVGHVWQLTPEGFEALRQGVEKARRGVGNGQGCRKNTTPVPHYSAQEVEAGLTEIALTSRQYKLASKRLRERGIDIPPSTLRTWALQTHAERLLELEKQVSDRLRGDLAARQAEIAERSGQIELKALERIESVLDELPPSALANVLRGLAVSRGVGVDKRQVLKQEPTEIRRQEVSGEELLRRLERTGALYTGNGPAGAIDAEVVEEAPELEEGAA